MRRHVFLAAPSVKEITCVHSSNLSPQCVACAVASCGSSKLSQLTALLENKEKNSSVQSVAGNKYCWLTGTRMWLPLHVDFDRVRGRIARGELRFPAHWRQVARTDYPRRTRKR
jgi:hypothetical protein